MPDLGAPTAKIEFHGYDVSLEIANGYVVIKTIWEDHWENPSPREDEGTNYVSHTLTVEDLDHIARGYLPLNMTSHIRPTRFRG